MDVDVLKLVLQVDFKVNEVASKELVELPHREVLISIKVL